MPLTIFPSEGDMRLFIGTKAILARPMNRQAYNDYRGWTLPADEDGDDVGMLVEYLDGGRANHPDHVGYISWSPIDVFKQAYAESGRMGFGEALLALESGQRMQRAGWNGRGMFIYYVGAGRYAPTTVAGEQIAHQQADRLVPYGPYLAIKSVDGTVVPWLASQTDILAHDWGVYDDQANGVASA